MSPDDEEEQLSEEEGNTQHRRHARERDIDIEIEREDWCQISMYWYEVLPRGWWGEGRINNLLT